MMSLAQQNFCFCTYTSGQTYRTLTKLLVQDLKQYAPEIPFIIFTDKPSHFSDDNNVMPFEHHRQGISFHNERRYAIAKAISLYNSCMYIDADVRICAPVPPEIQSKWLPGLTARSCGSLIKLMQERLSKTNPPNPSVVKQMKLIEKIARKLDIDLTETTIPFINEFLFVLTRDSGKEIEFLNLWEKLAYYTELNGWDNAPTIPMGFAAVQVGMPVIYDEMEGLDFFDDRIESVRIAQGQSAPDSKKEYFEAQRIIEKDNRTLTQKAVYKVKKNIDYSSRYLRLKVRTLISDFDFYKN
ncbi:MAG: hypothetical protein ACOVQ7_05985 [Limnoraphis robusta]